MGVFGIPLYGGLAIAEVEEVARAAQAELIAHFVEPEYFASWESRSEIGWHDLKKEQQAAN
jgi:hypothetical protein